MQRRAKKIAGVGIAAVSLSLLLLSCASVPGVNDRSDAADKKRQELWAAGEDYKARTAAVASSANGKIVYFHNDAAYARGSWFGVNISLGHTPKREFFRGRFYEVFYDGKLIGYLLMNPLVFAGNGNWFTKKPSENEAYRIVALSNTMHAARIILAQQPIQCETWEGGCKAVGEGKARVLQAPTLSHTTLNQVKEMQTMPFSFDEEGWQDKALQFVTGELDLIKADKARFEAYFLGEYAQDPFYHEGSRKKIPRE
jgi:hypothetical protein